MEKYNCERCGKAGTFNVAYEVERKKGEFHCRKCFYELNPPESCFDDMRNSLDKYVFNSRKVHNNHVVKNTLNEILVETPDGKKMEFLLTEPYNSKPTFLDVSFVLRDKEGNFIENHSWTFLTSEWNVKKGVVISENSPRGKSSWEEIADCLTSDFSHFITPD